jgi:precorrin-4/cobalt-precorrin-4 C11-methyltransferase
LSRAKVWFIGGGPGPPDLLTIRGARAIAEADIIIWGTRFLMEETVTECARSDAELVPWPPASMSDLLAAYDRAKADDLVVARLVGGDPAVYVSMGEEIDRVRQLGLPFEVVPGVGTLSAAAAALGGELATARTPESLVVTSPLAEIENLAGPPLTAAIYMAGRSRDELQSRLLASGYPEQTPCAIVFGASWGHQDVILCHLDQLEANLEELAMQADPELVERQTLVLAGPTVPEAPIRGPRDI